MLNQEQQGYIDMLRAGYPDIAESTLREMLTQAGWDAGQVESGIAAYLLPQPLPQPVAAQESFTGVSSGLQSPVASATSMPQHVIVNDASSPFASTAQSGGRKMLFVTLGALFFLGAVGAAGYFAYEKFFPAKPDALTNENVLVSVFAKLGAIETANYNTSIKLNVVAREADAKPFALAEEPTPEVLEKFMRDQDRLRDVMQIIQELRNSSTPPWTSGTANPVPQKKSYPASLVGVAKKTTDPQGQPYVYTRKADGTGFTFAVTMETKEGVDAVANGGSYARDVNDTRVNGMTVTLAENDYVYFYGDLKPAQPKLFGFFGLSEVEGMIPADVSGSLGISGTFDNSKSTPIDARLAIEGEATMGDAAFAFGVEGIKKGDKFYGIIHKMPAFFSAMGQLRGKWVSFTQADLIAQGYGSYVGEFIPSDDSRQKELMDKGRAQMKTLLEIATQDGLVVITQGPEKITEGEKVFYKYHLALAKDKLVPFYEHATKALEQYGNDSILKKDAKTLEYLTGEDFSLVFDYLKTNTTFTLLVDDKGFPAKSEIAVRYVPSSAARALKDHQLVMTLAFGFSEINESVKVDEPKESITIEDLMVEITGKSREQLRADRQSAGVEVVRRALRDYQTTTGMHPETLDDLKKTRKEVAKLGGKANTPGNSAITSYMDNMPFLKNIPQDVFTQAPFIYRPGGTERTNYELTYQMELPAYTKTANPADFYGERNWLMESEASYGENLYAPTTGSTKRLLQPKFVSGANIATKEYLSKTAEEDKKDDDKDRMTNALELIFGTNPQKADSDSDGFDDYEEIEALTNPLGPGKLDVKRSSFF